MRSLFKVGNGYCACSLFLLCVPLFFASLLAKKAVYQNVSSCTALYNRQPILCAIFVTEV